MAGALRNSAWLVWALLVPPALAQGIVYPTYPACTGGNTNQLHVPQATQRVRMTYRAGVMSGVEDMRYLPPWENYAVERYTYAAMSSSWTTEVKSAAGASLASKSGSYTFAMMTWPCNQWKVVNCTWRWADGVTFDGTQIEGAQWVDVSALAAAGDTTLTVERRLTGAAVDVERTLPNGTQTQFGKCHTPQPSISVEVPTFEMPSAFDSHGRMIAHIEAAWDRDQYTSMYQRKTTDTQPSAVPLGTRPQFLLTGGTRGMPANSRVWFRVLDPADPSPYVTGAAGDNRDPNGGTLSASDGRSAALGTVLYADTDANESLTLVLEGSDRYAGDNYEVIASVDPPGAGGKFPCENVGNCRTTGLITVWKRLYYEHAQMAREGAFLAADVHGGTNPCSATDPCELHVRSLAVNGVDVITPGASLTLIGTGGGAGVGSATPVSEQVQVAQSSPTYGPAIYQVGPEDFAVRLTTRPAHDYAGGTGRASYYDAVITTPDRFAADLGGIEQVLERSFVEYVPTPAAATVPYLGIAERADGSGAGLRRWLRSGVPGAQRLENNHRAIIAADRFAVGFNTATNQCGTDLGYRSPGGRYSFVFTTPINNSGAALNTFYPVTPTPHDQQGAVPANCATVVWNFGTPSDVLYAATAHEAVHQFSVNSGTGGHCNNNDYTGAYACLMRPGYPMGVSAAQVAARIVNLHSGANSEYTTIREEQDPSQ